MLYESEYELTSRPEVGAFLPAHGDYQTVLEIGCAKGGFRDSLSPNCEVWGVDPNETAASQASTRGYKIVVGRFEIVAGEIPDFYFDVIICNDVIEHIADYDTFLRVLKKKLKDTGCIIGSVPNVRYFGNLYKLLIKKDWKYEDQGILDKTHLRFFTEKSLFRTFTDTGYVVEEMKGINTTAQLDFQLP